MKSNCGKILMCALLTVLLLTISTIAYAVSDDVKVKIFTRPVFVEGQEVECQKKEGEDRYYLTYNGTSYIPLRVAGGWMGKNVGWDGATRTVTIDGEAEKVFLTESVGHSDKEAWTQGTKGDGLTAAIQRDVRIVVDGETKTFKNAKGEIVFPINYKNTLYLPVRNIGELCGMTVTYRAYNKETGHNEAIFLRTAMTDAQIAAGDVYLKEMYALTSYAELKAQGRTTASLDKLHDSYRDEDYIFNLMGASGEPDMEELRQYAEIGLYAMQEMLDTPLPDCPVLKAKHVELMAAAQNGKTACEKVLAAIDAGESYEKVLSLAINRNTYAGEKGASELCGLTQGPVNEMGFVLYEQHGKWWMTN